MRTADVASIIRDMRHDVVEKLVWRHMPEKAYPEQWNTPELMDEADEIFGFRPPVDQWAAEEGIAQQEIVERLTRDVDHAYAQKAAMLGPERLRAVEKQVLLSVVDMRWREHLSLLDHLRSVIHLRGYAQRDPLNEFKTEAFTLFERMLLDLRTTITRMLLKLQIGQADEQLPRPQMPARTYEIHQNPDTGENEMQREAPPPLAPDGFDRHKPSTWGKVSRNAPCPCGSGKKFKYCHGTAEAASA
jgi:preprotein translocase subunit SecA